MPELSTGKAEYSGSGMGCSVLVLVIGVLCVGLGLLLEVASWFTGSGFSFFRSFGGYGLIVMAAGALVFVVNLLVDPDTNDFSWALNDPQTTTPKRERLIDVEDWKDAERSARNFMRANGYGDAELTPPGADGGVDVVSVMAIAQVKHYKRPIGEPAIVQLAGSTMRKRHKGQEALFFSTGGFTPKAVNAAEELDVQLYKLKDGRRWVRVR